MEVGLTRPPECVQRQPPAAQHQPLPPGDLASAIIIAIANWPIFRLHNAKRPNEKNYIPPSLADLSYFFRIMISEDSILLFLDF